MDTASQGLGPSSREAANPKFALLPEAAATPKLFDSAQTPEDIAQGDLRHQAVTLPNLLTYARLLAVPFFAWAFVSLRPRLALATFAAAALTDGLDGLLARVLRQRTRLGGILDPAADKLLTLTALVLLVISGHLPWTLLAIVLLRDGCIMLGVARLRWTGRPVPSAPTRLGKYATFGLVVSIVLALVGNLSGPRQSSLDPYVVCSSLIAMECVGLTLVQYFLRWRRLMQAPH